MNIKASSSFLALLMNGKFTDLLCPWKINVDLDSELICVEKRNWFLIGKDSKEISFRFVRNVLIDQHLFGADLNIKVVGGTVEVFCLSKSDAKNIRDQLMHYNQTKKGKGIIFS